MESATEGESEEFPKLVELFKTSDGELFYNKGDALEHEEFISRTNKIQEALGVDEDFALALEEFINKHTKGWKNA